MLWGICFYAIPLSVKIVGLSPLNGVLDKMGIGMHCAAMGASALDADVIFRLRYGTKHEPVANKAP